MKKHLAIAAFAVMLQGCFNDPESARGFRLPAGDAEQGKLAFRDLQCGACHAVQGMGDLPEGMLDYRVTLGGDVTRVKTYGELVTSIINPSHKLAPGYLEDEVTVDGESLMATAQLNQVMTVQELIDVVAFLQPLYNVRPPQYNPYGYIYPPERPESSPPPGP
jgi:L-cysteine S-thiosulfotransferase